MVYPLIRLYTGVAIHADDLRTTTESKDVASQKKQAISSAGL